MAAPTVASPRPVSTRLLGLFDTGGRSASGGMPSFGNRLTPGETEQVVEYTRTL